MDKAEGDKPERLIFAYTFGGAVHLWSKEKSEDEEKPWKPKLTVKGHFREVTDLSWDPSTKSCVISCSADQTTRLLTKYARVEGQTGYFEISRPQVHGYDINCITCLQNQDQLEKKNEHLAFKILSGGDEKVIRLFEAPYNFVKRYNNLHPDVQNRQIEQMRFRSDIDNAQVESIIGEREEQAKKQPLGLMNKP